MIVVLAVLAAMLLPAFSAARNKARDLQCRNNARQINLSYHVRITDGGGNRLDGPEVVEWQVREFGCKELGWVCPLAPARVEPGWINNGNFLAGGVFAAWEDPGWLQDGGNQPLFGPNLRSGSYCVNGYLTEAALYNRWPGYMNAPVPHAFRLQSQVAHADATPVLGDGVVPRSLPCETDLPPTDLNGHYTSGLGVLVIPRHGSHPTPVPDSWPRTKGLPGAVNLSFFDAHVEGVRLEQLWGFAWHDQYVAPSPRPGR